MDCPDKYSIFSLFHLIFWNCRPLQVFNHAFIPFYISELNTSRGIQFPIHSILLFVLSTSTSIQTTRSFLLYFWIDYPYKYWLFYSSHFIFWNWLPLQVFKCALIPFFSHELNTSRGIQLPIHSILYFWMDYPDKYSIFSLFHLIFWNSRPLQVFNHAFIPFHFFELNTSRGI